MVPRTELAWSGRSIVYRLMMGLSEDGPSGKVRTVMEYSDANPYEVRLALIPEDLTVGRIQIYKFARELLWDGLAAPAGNGDVQIRPHDTVASLLTIRLRPDGAYPFELDAPREILTDFIEQAYMLVPVGHEEPDDLDAELARLLGGAS